MRFAFFVLIATIGVACAQLPVTNRITITAPPEGSVTVLEVLPRTNAPPFPPHLPYSVQMRIAAQEAAGKSAPWTQRFIAVKVTEEARTREDGLFTTNYFVTCAPVSDETNSAVAWGATKARTFRLETTRPTKKGDEFDFYPARND